MASIWQRDTTWADPGICLIVVGSAMMIIALLVGLSTTGLPVWWLLWLGAAVAVGGIFCLFKVAFLAASRTTLDERRNN